MTEPMTDIEFSDVQPAQIDDLPNELPVLPHKETVEASARRCSRPSGRGSRVILPRENEHDLDELPAETREAIAFVLVDSIEEVFAAAFGLNSRVHSNGRVRAVTSRR
jgi:hypothetical protein